jgi:hypothetical protein
MITALQSRIVVGNIVLSIIIPDADLIDIQPKEYTELYATVHDAKRFFFTFGSIIEVAPHQVYTSALIFSPVCGVVVELI